MFGSLAAGARAAVTGALETLGAVAHHAEGHAVAVPGAAETGYVGADAICAAAGKRFDDYLDERANKVRCV